MEAGGGEFFEREAVEDDEEGEGLMGTRANKRDTQNDEDEEEEGDQDGYVGSIEPAWTFHPSVFQFGLSLFLASLFHLSKCCEGKDTLRYHTQRFVVVIFQLRGIFSLSKLRL